MDDRPTRTDITSDSAEVFKARDAWEQKLMLLPSVIWAASFALYLLFVGHAPVPELVAAAMTSALATAYHLHVHRHEHRRFALRAPWFHLVIRTLRAIAVDTLLVGAALARAILRNTHAEGMVEQPFDPGGATPKAAARRALIVLAASIAPNTYVIDLRSRPPGLQEHRLVPRPPRKDGQWPL